MFQPDMNPKTKHMERKSPKMTPNDQPNGQSNEDGKQYLKIPTEIIFVEDAASLDQCQKAVSLVPDGTLVGLDMEWKSPESRESRKSESQKVAIVQLSLKDKVFIVNASAITENVSDASIVAFGDAFFANENVQKLGYGVENDFKNLINTWPVLDCVMNMKNVVDLKPLSERLLTLDVIRRKVKTPACSERGLSLLVQQCLGLPLDKTCQLSDWEQRPLSREQLEYAALDARCLIEVFAVLMKWMAEGGKEIDLNEFRPKLSFLFPKQSRRKKGRGKRNPKPGSPGWEGRNESIDSGLLNSRRVLVDITLQGLGKRLRREYGFDVAVIKDKKERLRAPEKFIVFTISEHRKICIAGMNLQAGYATDHLVNIAIMENRVILTTGTPYHTLRVQVPRQCVCVPPKELDKQIKFVLSVYDAESPEVLINLR